MLAATTEGVRVSVETTYQHEYSNPTNYHFMFSYKIRIENRSSEVIQLMRRHWFIFDSVGILREVEGEGVVGLQPILHPGEVHEYISACNLKTEMGKMYGTFEMRKVESDFLFNVRIPEFQLICPFKLN